MNYTQPTLETVSLTQKYNDTIGNHINHSWTSIRDNTTIAEASSMLAISPFCGFPVVNSENILMGFITEKECLKYTLSEKYYHEPSSLVSHYMNRNIIVFRPDLNLLKALEVFIDHPYHAFPVVDKGGQFLGCASRKELLRVALKLKESDWFEDGAK
jgi:predicted transcriptional regulator